MQPALSSVSPLLQTPSRARIAVPSPSIEPDAIAQGNLSARDKRIIALALQKLGGSAPDFGEAVRALHEAVEELIPAGRTYYLGANNRGPIIGSIISGVGITAGAKGVLLVRVDHAGHRTSLGSLSR